MGDRPRWTFISVSPCLIKCRIYSAARRDQPLDLEGQSEAPSCTADTQASWQLCSTLACGGAMLLETRTRCARWREFGIPGLRDDKRCCDTDLRQPLQLRPRPVAACLCTAGAAWRAGALGKQPIERNGWWACQCLRFALAHSGPERDTHLGYPSLPSRRSHPSHPGSMAER